MEKPTYWAAKLTDDRRGVVLTVPIVGEPVEPVVPVHDGALFDVTLTLDQALDLSNALVHLVANGRS